MERLHFHFSLSCTGEGNGNPLQCSCLENPGDGEPGRLPSMGSHRVGHDWSDLAAAAATWAIQLCDSLRYTPFQSVTFPYIVSLLAERLAWIRLLCFIFFFKFGWCFNETFTFRFKAPKRILGCRWLSRWWSFFFWTISSHRQSKDDPHCLLGSTEPSLGSPLAKGSVSLAAE